MAQNQAQNQFQVDRTTALFERPAITIVDQARFDRVKQALEDAFAPGKVEKFLRSVERAGLRIREFEQVLQAGKLGAEAAAEYAKLGDADQGLVRELYLASVEKVEMPLRDKYFKIYAYY
ncbi:MAG: hypothetical protein ACLGQX_09360 [Acidobacteriota bacterium]